MTTLSREINDFGGPEPPKMSPNEAQKAKKIRQDSDEDTNNGQRRPKVRSKTVPEAHLETQKAYGPH